jgi:DNA mismatch repair protein MutS
MPPPRVRTAMDKLYDAEYQTYIDKYGPKTALLYLVGGFYTLFDYVHRETGKAKRNLLDIVDLCAGTPTWERDYDAEWHRVSWGVPEYVLAKYERILVSAGYTVVVFGQDRDATDKVTGRSLEYVSSPGTFVDPQVAEDKRVVSVFVEEFKDRQGRTKWCMASTAFDVSTGECVSMETVVPVLDGRPNLDTLEAFWASYMPSELIVLTREVKLKESQVRAWFSGQMRGPIHFVAMEPASAAATRGSLQFLHRIYAPRTALRTEVFLGVERYPAALESLTYLLQWIEGHSPSFLARLEGKGHRMWEPRDALVLGNAALQQLGMLPIGKENECMLHWLQKAATPMGRRALRERCVRPITDVATLEARQERIEELRDMTLRLYGIGDLPRLYRRFKVGKGTREDLEVLLSSYQRLQQIADAVDGTKSALPAEAKTHLTSMFETWSLERVRASKGKMGLGPHHPWQRGVHAELDRLEDEWLGILSEVQNTQQAWNTLLEESDAIKVAWDTEANAWEWTATKRRAQALAVVLKNRKKITLSHKANGSKNDILECPQIAELNERSLRVWEAWVVAAEPLWSTWWSSWNGSDVVVDWISCLDVEYALARCAEEYGYVRPRYVGNTEVAGVSVEGLRHPILERVHTETPYIAHSLSLGPHRPQEVGAEHGMLLYGVNAAGKSSLSKAVGLAVLMAQIGMPVAASAMILAPYNGLYTRILGNDNLWAGMSSFVVEMTELRTILGAGPRSLVLGDELCAGTETTSAIAIVGAGIQRLVEKGVQFLFATHLHELMEVPEIAGILTVRPYHLTVQSEGDRLVYDRKLKEGTGPAIYGLEVCKGLDMDPVFLERAVELRRKWEGAVDLAKVSRYNAAVPVQVCDVCGARTALETHHIVPQAAADQGGFVAHGRHKNERGNLVVLCGSCHDKHHAGDIEVRGWQATTAGRTLDVRTLEKHKLDLSRFKCPTIIK